MISLRFWVSGSLVCNSVILSFKTNRFIGQVFTFSRIRVCVLRIMD